MAESKYEALVRGGAALLGEVHDLAVQCTPRLRFDIAKNGWRHIYAVGFYASLTELSGSCVALARARAYVGIPILARTCLEAFMDLKNLLANDTYVHHLELKRAKEWVKILDEAQNGVNAYVAGIANDPEFAANRKEYEAALAEAKKAGGEDLTAFRRFELAGHTQEYRSLYNFLCAEAHNNGRALMRRHLDTSKKSPELVIYDAEPGFVIPALSTLASLLLEASQWMHERFGETKFEARDLPGRLKAFDSELVARG
jgi:hypothetical protein